MNLEGIDTFLFDMGNTVLDFHAHGPSDAVKDALGLDAMVAYARERYGIEVSGEDVSEKLLSRWKAYQQTERYATLTEWRIDRELGAYLENIGAPLKDADVVRMLSAYFGPYAESVKRNENIEECLKMLKKRDKRVGIVSNIPLPEETFVAIFKRVGLDSYIDAYTFSYTVGALKPSKKIFQAALRHHNRVAAKCVMIGDSLQDDIAGARATGMRTCWYNPKKEKADASAFDLEIHDFKELLLLVR